MSIRVRKKKTFNVHLIRFLCSVGGTDKILMTIQYTSRLLYCYYMRTKQESKAKRAKNLEDPIDDFRILLRYYGLVPLLQWIVHVESNPPPSKLLLNINRMQNMANMCYYPMEHLYWLGKHEVIPMKKETTKKLYEWSCRLWTVYIVLQFWNIWEEWKLIKKRQNYVNTYSQTQPTTKEEEIREKRSMNKIKQQMEKEKITIIMNLIINTAYLPLTLNWSFKECKLNDAKVGTLGLIAALCQFFTSWAATS